MNACMQNKVCVLTCQNSITLPQLKEIFFSPSKHSGRAMGQYEDTYIQNKVTQMMIRSMTRQEHGI